MMMHLPYIRSKLSSFFSKEKGGVGIIEIVLIIVVVVVLAFLFKDKIIELFNSIWGGINTDDLGAVASAAPAP